MLWISLKSPLKEAKVLYEVLLKHDASTLDRDQDSQELNLALDHLRGMLMDIRDRKPASR